MVNPMLDQARKPSIRNILKELIFQFLNNLQLKTLLNSARIISDELEIKVNLILLNRRILRMLLISKMESNKFIGY